MNGTPLAARIEDLVCDPRVGWSVGVPGAIAEFYWSAGEPTAMQPLEIGTPRGALRLQLHPACRLFASEALGHSEDSWSQSISVCLPDKQSALDGRHTIAEIGPDRGATRVEDRDAILFDLGIGGSYFRLCVRVAPGPRAACLRSALGKRLLDSDTLIHALVEMSPDRVFESKLARIEVRQPIAAPHGVSPEGPHTHLLPHLLDASPRGEGSAPVGWVAQAIAYPPHPLRDALGQPKPFERSEFDAFQNWLREYGDPGQLALKRTVIDAIRFGARPEALTAMVSDSERYVVRIVLRQLSHTEPGSAALARWIEAYGA